MLCVRTIKEIEAGIGEKGMNYKDSRTIKQKTKNYNKKKTNPVKIETQ